MNSISEKVGEMVGNNDLKEAISYLHMVLKNSPMLDEILIQSARLNDVMMQIRLGTVEYEKANITKNQIRYGLLDLAREIENCASNNNELQKEIDRYLESQPKIVQISTGSGDNVGRDKITYTK
jgi:response regulator of citrate/malate metabolism